MLTFLVGAILVVLLLPFMPAILRLAAQAGVVLVIGACAILVVYGVLAMLAPPKAKLLPRAVAIEAP